jgi:pimeloyl-ACP methyl ester carboxylesterase
VATFCLLHGAWHEPSCWDALRDQLEARGHRTMAPDLPLHDSAASFDQRIRPAVDALDGVEGRVVVMVHSQSSALGPLLAVARPVSLLVYLCPRMGAVEVPMEAPKPFREGIPFPPDRPDGTTAWDPDVATAFMYSRLPPEDAQTLAQRLRPMAMPPGDYPLAEHPDVPVALLYASEDEFFDPAFERFMARDLLGIDPIELEGGHFPMIEDPGGLARLLDDLAGGRS